MFRRLLLQIGGANIENRRAISRRSQLVVRAVGAHCSNRGGGSDWRSSTQLLAYQRSDLGSEELDRVHRLCMINMGDVHFETINLHQLVQPDDLGSDSLWIAEEQCAFGPVISSTSYFSHSGSSTSM